MTCPTTLGRALTDRVVTADSPEAILPFNHRHPTFCGRKKWTTRPDLWRRAPQFTNLEKKILENRRPFRGRGANLAEYLSHGSAEIFIFSSVKTVTPLPA